MVAIGKRLIAYYLAFITDMQKFHHHKTKKWAQYYFECGVYTGYFSP